MKKIWMALVAATAFACSGDGSIDSTASGLIEVLEIEVNGDSWTQSSRREFTRPQPSNVGAGVVGSSHALSYSCAGGANPPLKLWDRASYTGNLLCVSGSGTVDLSEVPRGHSSTWENAIRSYQSNSEWGYFKRINLDGGEVMSTSFCADQSSANPKPAIRDTTSILLPNSIQLCF